MERGHDPLLHRFILMTILFRVEVQKQTFGHTIFGRGDIPKANDRFYHWVWDHKTHVCENCMKPLWNYSAVFISHILTRGANPEMAHDPRNTNILCFECHNTWEDETTRKSMRIYDQNQLTINLLKSEYGKHI